MDFNNSNIGDNVTYTEARTIPYMQYVYPILYVLGDAHFATEVDANVCLTLSRVCVHAYVLHHRFGVEYHIDLFDKYADIWKRGVL